LEVLPIISMVGFELKELPSSHTMRKVEGEYLKKFWLAENVN